MRRSTIWQVHLGKERGGTERKEDVGELRGQKSLQRCCFCCMGHSVDNGGLTSLHEKLHSSAVNLVIVKTRKRNGKTWEIARLQ